MRQRNLVSFDYAIKRQLRNKANYDIVSGFLSELFGRDVKIEKILETERNKKRRDEKGNRMDILAEEGDGSKVIIELQFHEEIDYFQRMLFETSSAVAECLDEGDEYGKIGKVYSVNIMYFDLGTGRDYIYHGATSFKGLHSREVLKLSAQQQFEFVGKKLPDDLYPEYYIINLNRFSGKIKDTLDEWVEYLKSDKVGDSPKAKGLAKAKKILVYDKLTPAEQKDYDHEVDQRRSLKSMFYTARLDGKAEGKAEGEAIGEAREKIETAKRMKLKGYKPADIVEMTGLSETEIGKI